MFSDMVAVKAGLVVFFDYIEAAFVKLVGRKMPLIHVIEDTHIDFHFSHPPHCAFVGAEISGAYGNRP